MIAVLCETQHACANSLATSRWLKRYHYFLEHLNAITKFKSYKV